VSVCLSVCHIPSLSQNCNTVECSYFMVRLLLTSVNGKVILSRERRVYRGQSRFRISTKTAAFYNFEIKRLIVKVTVKERKCKDHFSCLMLMFVKSGSIYISIYNVNRSTFLEYFFLLQGAKVSDRGLFSDK